MFDNLKVAVIGCGYVGTPLSLRFGKIYETIGFDVNENRIKQLKNSYDKTNEASSEDFKEATNLTFTSRLNDLAFSNVYIITVPTPIDEFNCPDLTCMKNASEMVGDLLTVGDDEKIVIYESTVYPGCIEEVCVPILEKFSNKKYNKDFSVGYSPERINPGDKIHRLETIKKVTSGSNPLAAKIIDDLYKSIIDAGTYPVSSIKVAEAAKVIENTQRDINIAFMNELSIIFEKMGIKTKEVLKAAGTKWNFLPFEPGLVGGHCIGVDPYYLTYKAESLGYIPQVILSGRRLNDSMGSHIATRFIKKLCSKNINVSESNILVLGITFKENCPDIRNSKVVDIINCLKEYGCNIHVYDPIANPEDVLHEYGIKLITSLDKYDGVVVAVAHDQFKIMDYATLLRTDIECIFDVKSILNFTCDCL
jgi:UDP-N-acetyl-D-galactosamine dehydrogenase